MAEVHRQGQVGRQENGGDPLVTVEEVRRLALSLPRTTEHLIRDNMKFRVKQIVYVAFSRDETLMGFAFPKEERLALVESGAGPVPDA